MLRSTQDVLRDIICSVCDLEHIERALRKVPDVLAAIKAELNRDRCPGRFVLAGSARHQWFPSSPTSSPGGLSC